MKGFLLRIAAIIGLVFLLVSCGPGRQEYPVIPIPAGVDFGLDGDWRLGEIYFRAANRWDVLMFYDRELGRAGWHLCESQQCEEVNVTDVHLLAAYHYGTQRFSPSLTIANAVQDLNALILLVNNCGKLHRIETTGLSKFDGRVVTPADAR